MKFIAVLIVIVAVFFGGVILYKKYFKKETASVTPIPEQVIADQTAPATKTETKATTEAVTPTDNSTGVTHEKLSGDFKNTESSSDSQPKTLITAETPIKHSRWGKKIDSIYMKHNAALEKAAKDK